MSFGVELFLLYWGCLHPIIISICLWNFIDSVFLLRVSSKFSTVPIFMCLINLLYVNCKLVGIGMKKNATERSDLNNLEAWRTCSYMDLMALQSSVSWMLNVIYKNNQWSTKRIKFTISFRTRNHSRICQFCSWAGFTGVKWYPRMPNTWSSDEGRR